MENSIEIYTTADNQSRVEVRFEEETVWLNRQELAKLFDRDIKTIGKHINNVFTDGELEKDSVVANFATTASDGKTYSVDHYNLDVIISVGYRVKSKRGVQFRRWATERLKDYLVEGYALNEKRLAQKNLEVRHLKDGIRILHRALEEQLESSANQWLSVFARGLELLDDYDHERLDSRGLSQKEAIYPEQGEYLALIREMYADFGSGVFARPKDESFASSINQIRQSFGGNELYPTIEEKAANLLYFVVKNHSFVDGNKRIAAACFLLFLDRNGLLTQDGEQILSNEALASLTLYIAASKPDEAETVKRLIISVLNRSRSV